MPSPSPAFLQPTDPGAPVPLPAADVRAARARWIAIVRDAQATRHLVAGIPSLAGASAGMAGVAQCRFHERDILRVPVVVTDRARETLWHAHHEARLFPQALAEYFAAHAGVARVEVDVVLRGEAGTLGEGVAELPPEEWTPGIPANRPPHLHPDRALVAVTVHHLLDAGPTDVADPATGYPPHTFLLPLYQLHAHSASREPAMRAHETARHLLTLYPYPVEAPLSAAFAPVPGSWRADPDWAAIGFAAWRATAEAAVAAGDTDDGTPQVRFTPTRPSTRPSTRTSRKQSQKKP